MKKLEEMTLEELWQLFPIVLAPHRSCWKDWFAQEAKALETLLPSGTEIHHIGSTAVPGIQAKPIVDILACLPERTDMSECCRRLGEAGWICMSQGASRMSFNKGYTEKGFADRVFHLHLRLAGNQDELYFRDWLNSHPGDAARYEALKLELWKKYEHDRNGYTRAKGTFVQEITEKAKQQQVLRAALLKK